MIPDKLQRNSFDQTANKPVWSITNITVITLNRTPCGAATSGVIMSGNIVNLPVMK